MRQTVFFILIFILTAQFSKAQVGYKKQNYSFSQANNGIDYNNPKEYQIEGIEVKGATTLNKSAIISLSGLKVGDRVTIPSETISSAIKKLWKQGIIEDVSVSVAKTEGDKAWLVINIKERPRLTKINIEGIGKSQKKEILKEIDLILGRILTESIQKNTELRIKRYYENKGFLKAKVQLSQKVDTVKANGVSLKIDIKKGKKVRINDIKIVGNQKVDATKLKQKMKKTKEKVRVRIFRDIANRIAAVDSEKVKNLFKPTYDATWSDFKRYINDNIKVNFFSSSKFIGKEFESDQDLLIAYYNSKGYRDARVLKDSVWLDQNDQINIDIEVFEGKRYYFRNINWVGNYIYTEDQLNRVLRIDKGDVYDMENLNKRLQFDMNDQDISSLYMDKGYLAFRVNPVEVKVEGDSIDVEMRIYEGAQFTIRNVGVTGNDKTNDHVIYRELRTRPGDLFNRSTLIRTQRELSQLGYFDPEQINPQVQPNMADETVDITWELAERSADQIELSGGWGGSYGFIGTLGLSFSNFSIKNIFNKKGWDPLPTGDGQKLSLRAQANGAQYQSYSISFQEPWLGGKKPQSFSVSLSHANQKQFRYDPQTRQYDRSETQGSLQMTGVTLGLGRRLTWPDDYFVLNNTLSYNRYDVQDMGTSLGFRTGVANNIAFTTSLSRNSIDQAMYPRSGSSLSLSLSMTPPYSLWKTSDFYENATNAEKSKWVEYFKVMFDMKNYLKISGDLVLEAKAHFGFLNSYTSRAELGPFERFTMGGSGLAGQNVILSTDVIGLRGYEDASITPQKTLDDGNIIQGGTAYAKFGAELRYPLSLAQSATIYVLGFAEAGNNWDGFDKYNPFDLYKSAGFGARIFMPAFGMIGIDWAYGFDEYNKYSGINNKIGGSQFHFTIGQQLR